MAGYHVLTDRSAGKFGEIPDISSLKENESKNIPLLKQIKRDLKRSKFHCQVRGLNEAKKWACEMLYFLQDVEYNSNELPVMHKELGTECDTYDMSMSCFEAHEYDRCAFYGENASTPILRFLHFYARYRSGEKKKNDESVDPVASIDNHNGPHLKELQSEFSLIDDEGDQKNGLDAWHLYLYGVVLRRLDQQKESLEMLCRSIQLEPTQWHCWMEISLLITGKEMLNQLQQGLPDHWMKKFFLAHLYVKLNQNAEAAEIYTEFESAGMKKCHYVMAQMAIVARNLKDMDQAIGVFKELEKADPFRLEHMDVYSNMLYVKGLRVELSHLAHRVAQVNKYKVETCCIVGNYYSLRGGHEKAVQYFQRALRMDPNYLAGWTLMGHEYMEMKNAQAAIQCYRQAIEVNRLDYRAWYGLGQTYELLKLPAYCIYYYKQAQYLNPMDSRILIALGDNYEKLDKNDEAKKCYHKAHSVGDVEDLALLRLARLYSQLGEKERAKVVYERFLLETEDDGNAEERASDKGQAYYFLAEHHLNKGMLDLAYKYAHECTLFAETREAGKTMLREIANKKQHADKKNGSNGVGSILDPITFNTNEDESEQFNNAFTPQNLTF